jgi:hypothetical protein
MDPVSMTLGLALVHAPPPRVNVARPGNRQWWLVAVTECLKFTENKHWPPMPLLE